jgi:hypothetical protein
MPLLSLDPVPLLETADSGLLLFRDNVQLNYNKIQDIVNKLDSVNVKDGSLTPVDLTAVPAAMVLNNANAQVIPNTTDTTLIYDTAVYGAVGMASLVDGRLYATIDGIYHCSMTMRVISGGAVGERYCALFKNSSAIDRVASQNVPATNGTTTLSCSGDVNLTSGEHVISMIFQNSGGNLTMDTSFKSGRFSMHYVSRLI